MKSIVIPLAAAILLGSAVSAQADYKADSIEYRQATMVMMKWNLKPMGGMVKGKIPFDAAQFRARAEALATVSGLDLLPAFPEGSTDEFDSSAKAKIWSNWDDFKEKFETLRREAKALAKVATAGDEMAMKKQFKVTAKSCKGCHDDYRSKK